MFSFTFSTTKTTNHTFTSIITFFFYHQFSMAPPTSFFVPIISSFPPPSTPSNAELEADVPHKRELLALKWRRAHFLFGGKKEKNTYENKMGKNQKRNEREEKNKYEERERKEKEKLRKTAGHPKLPTTLAMKFKEISKTLFFSLSLSSNCQFKNQTIRWRLQNSAI